MREQLEKIREEALNQIEASEALEKLNEIRVAYLGKKGELTNLFKGMKNVAPEDRPKEQGGTQPSQHHRLGRGGAHLRGHGL